MTDQGGRGCFKRTGLSSASRHLAMAAQVDPNFEFNAPKVGLHMIFCLCSHESCVSQARQADTVHAVLAPCATGSSTTLPILARTMMPTLFLRRATTNRCQLVRAESIL